MASIGILAYGSLIADPGIELESLILEKIIDIDTPFNIEFSRSSSSRDGAPTVVPVEGYGASVKAVILVLKDTVTIDNAKDILWRRETRNETSSKPYPNPPNPRPNQVVIGEITGLGGVETVLFTKIGANIDSLSSKKLADLAIKSAKGEAGKKDKDGISYLISIKNQNIVTPLMPEYEEEIIKAVGGSSLAEALKNVLKNV